MNRVKDDANKGRELLKRKYMVPMADVDGANIVYFGNPYRWKEMVFTQWLHEIGYPLSKLILNKQGFPCVQSRAEYYVPMYLDQELILTLIGQEVRNSSIKLRLEIHDVDDLLHAIVETTNVWWTPDAKGHQASSRVPDWVRNHFRAR